LFTVEIHDFGLELFFLLFEHPGQGLEGQVQLVQLAVAHLIKFLIYLLEAALRLLRVIHQALVLLHHIREVIFNLFQVNMVLLDDVAHPCMLDHTLRT